MTIREAITQRISRVRRPMWANPEAYLRLPLLKDGMSGAWAYLFDEWGQRAIDVPVGSQEIIVVIPDGVDDYEAYTGTAHATEADSVAARYEEK